MSLAVNGAVAVFGWTSLVLLSYAPAPFSTVALIVASGLFLACLGSLLLAVTWAGVLRGLVAGERAPHSRRRRQGRETRP